jgi:hypothetical protein
MKNHGFPRGEFLLLAVPSPAVAVFFVVHLDR